MAPVTIRSVATELVDLPLRRRHSFATASAEQQSYVIVRIQDEDGITGLGEGAAPAGPWWGMQTVEAMQAVIDCHLGPVLVGADATRLEHVHELLARAAPAERAARSALEMAVLDLAGKALRLPAFQLLGGLARAAIPAAWALSAREEGSERAEIAERLDAGHTRFKLKAGALDPEADVARALALVELLGDRADLVVDPNGSWDELTALRCCRRLADAGVAFVEQPLPAWNVAGLTRLREETGVAIMADESVQTLQDALRAAGVAPERCVFVNVLHDDPRDGEPCSNTLVALHALAHAGATVVALGRRVQGVLRRGGISYIPLTHPAARGAIRKRAAYQQHVREVLWQANLLPPALR
jgi:muconate cycloisomerase